MQLIKPIILANYTEQLVYKTRPSWIVTLLIFNGYSKDELKYQKKFETALKDIINQVKNN